MRGRRGTANLLPLLEQPLRLRREFFLRRILRRCAHHQAKALLRNRPARLLQRLPLAILRDFGRHANHAAHGREQHMFAAQADVAREERTLDALCFLANLHNHRVARFRVGQPCVLLFQRQKAVFLLPNIDERRLHPRHNALHAPQQHRFRRVALLREKDFRQLSVFQYANQRLFTLMHKQCSHRFSKGVSSPFSSRPSKPLRIISASGAFSSPQKVLSALNSISGLHASVSVSTMTA